MKECFKCNNKKSTDDFYKHSGMQDGLLNKCKECCRKECRLNLKKNMLNPKWVDKEKKRQKIKAVKTGKVKHLRYREKYPEKYKAKTQSQRVKLKVKGNHKHHWSYNEEHYKDVIELSVKDHLTIHRFTIYDQERMMYRIAKDGVLLDSKILTIGFMESIGIKPF